MLVCLSGCGGIPDGEYTASVTLTGGSGRAYVESPCTVSVKNGKATADIIWSSPNYDYMMVDGQQYLPVNTQGNSEFVIPVVFDKEMAVQADTTAMSTPHLIDYKLTFSLSEKSTTGEEAAPEEAAGFSDRPDIPGLTYASTDENILATGFLIHRYEKGYALLQTDDGRNYLVVPKDRPVPELSGEETIVLQKPLDKIYLAATGAMCHFDSLGAVSHIALSGADEDDWYIESAKKAMESGDILYGGKYSAPDYEMCLELGIDVAIENTMILHTPKVMENFEDLGIPTFIDRSSYEEDPIGRLEWIKVYGLFTDKEEEASKEFALQKNMVDDLELAPGESPTVAVFAVNSNHQISTKKGNDYLARMIETAGGDYLAPVSEEGKPGSTQMTISREAFYDYAKDADILIYNATIQDAPQSLSELVAMDKTLADFKAVKEGRVYCIDKSLYQFANKTGQIIENLNEIVTGQQEETEFFSILR